MANVAEFISERTRTKKRIDTGSTVLKTSFELYLNQFLALLLLVPLAPTFLIIAFLVWRVDGGPFIFAHYRVGKDGRLFKCMKFRSMRQDSDRVLAELLENNPQARLEWQRDRKLVNDPRITGVGHFIRKTSLDELPQLMNVLRGEMNLVGPRPVTVAELSKYGTSRWHYVSVKPGMTGLWQVSGRNNTTYEERVALDRLYVESHSFFSDVAILFKTVKVVLLREGAR
jgi:exopolysaccharide production protein ExoY